MKSGQTKIDVVKKHSEADLGIRAHPNLTIGMSLQSVLMPHQNEFIFIWLYFGFAVYFWVQVGFIASQDERYGFRFEESSNYMLAATLAIALTVTVTLTYLTFYSMSPRTERILNNLDWSFKLLAVYGLTIVFIAAEFSLYPIRLSESLSLGLFLMYLTGSVALVLLILVQFDSLKTIVWWITFGYLFLFFLVDFFFLASQRQVKNFYLLMLIFLGVLAVAGLFVFFHFPERLCIEQRLPQLFLSSHVWYALAYLLLLYAYQLSLYVMFKYNESLALENQ